MEIQQKMAGRPGSHLEVMPLVFGKYPKILYFGEGDRTKKGRVSLRGDREGCRWYLGNIQNRYIIFLGWEIQQKMAGSHLEVIEGGCHWSELLPKPCLVW